MIKCLHETVFIFSCLAFFLFEFAFSVRAKIKETKENYVFLIRI